MHRSFVGDHNNEGKPGATIRNPNAGTTNGDVRLLLLLLLLLNPGVQRRADESRSQTWLGLQRWRLDPG